MTLSATIVEKAQGMALSVNEATDGGSVIPDLPAAVWIVTAVIGLIFCIFGWRLVRPLNVIADIAAGIFLGDMLSDTAFASLVAEMPWLRFVLMLAIGALCGYITHKFFYVLLFLADYAGLAVGADLALMLLLPEDLSFVALIIAVLAALPIAIILFQLIIPAQIFVTDLLGSVLVAGSVAILLSMEGGIVLAILGGAFLGGVIAQGRSAIIAKKNLMLERFSRLLSRCGYNAGRVSDDFVKGFRKTYKTRRAFRK